jgi:hypothetical protein
MPNSRALVSATETTRSLNENVGLTVSFFSHRSLIPSSAPRRGAGIRGVKPAPRSTRGVASDTGNRSTYRQIERGPAAICSRLVSRSIAS